MVNLKDSHKNMFKTGGLVEVHHVVPLDVDLVDCPIGPIDLTLPSCLQCFLCAMCVFEQLLGRLVELHHVVLLDVHLLQLLQLASKVSSVAHQIHILHLTEIIW